VANESAGAGGQRARYVCMPGSPYTGSTLLGTILNSHPECASIGAATGLTHRAELATYRCSCGRLFRECEFWAHIASRTGELGHPVSVYKTNFWNTNFRLSGNRMVNALLARSLGWTPANDVRDAVMGTVPWVREALSQTAWNSWSLATAVLERTGKTVFVDTARDHQRPKHLATHPRLDVKVIHLVRDPRGNVASIMKHTGADVTRAARQWKHYNVEAARVRRYLPTASWLSLRYDQLCADPSGVLAGVSDFLGVARVPMGQGFRQVEHHIIGNSMRLTGVDEIREDLSWQSRLSRADLDVIARITGPVSHRFGFAWP
jgi:hypothetical protein